MIDLRMQIVTAKTSFHAGSGFTVDEDFIEDVARMLASMVRPDNGHLAWCAHRDERRMHPFYGGGVEPAVECSNPKACEAARRAKAAVEAFDRDVARKAGEGAAGA